MRWRSTVLHPSPGTWCWLIDMRKGHIVVGCAIVDGSWFVSWRGEPDHTFKATHYWVIELPYNLPGEPEE